MHLVVPRNLSNRLDAHQGFQSHLGLEGTCIPFPFSFAHSSAVLSCPAEPEKSNLATGPNYGVHFWLLDTNGLPIAWDLTYFGQTNVDANADPDHDGASNMQEYLAGTNPLDGTDNLRVTSFGFLPGGGTAAITWRSVPTRLYRVLSTEAIDDPASWADAGPGLLAPDPSGLTTSTLTNTTAQQQFYRIQAVRPLSP
jgi:hypothetical protein